MTILVAGTILQERYKIVRPIGQGGMGTVYEAVQERLRRRVAVKQLLIVGEVRHNRAFLREAQILANLEHPSLPNIIDYFTDDAGHFLVMDFIQGDDLAAQLVQRGSPFPTDKVMQWADQVLDVLDYLHTQRPEPIYHGDIKPHNLKLKPNGEIILLDFGLAKGYLAEMSHVSGESSIVGYTPGFSPPEQVEGLGIDGRSDLYSLGATLHRLLTNTSPVDERSRLRAVVRGRLDPLRPAHEINPLVPPTVSDVLVQALALEPEERPASAVAMRAALQKVGSSTDRRPPPISSMLRIGRQFFQGVSSLGMRPPALSPKVELPLAPTPGDIQPPVVNAAAIEAELTEVDASAIKTRDGETGVGVPSTIPFAKEVPPEAVSHVQPDAKIDMSVAVPEGSFPITASPQTPIAADATVRAAADVTWDDAGSLIPTADPDAQFIDAPVTVLPSPLSEQVVAGGQPTMVGELAPQDNHHLNNQKHLPYDDLPAHIRGKAAKPIGVPDPVVPTLISDTDSISGLQAQQSSVFGQAVTARDRTDAPHENLVLRPTESSAHTPLMANAIVGESKPSLLSSGDFAVVDPAPLIADTELAEVADVQSPVASLAHNPVADDRRNETSERIGGVLETLPPTTMAEPEPRLRQAGYWAIRGTAVLLVLLVGLGLGSSLVSRWAINREPSTPSTGVSSRAASLAAANTKPTTPSTAVNGDASVSSSSGNQIAEVTKTPTILPTPTVVTEACNDDQALTSETGSAQDHLKNGEAALKAKLYPEAIREYTWALKLDPKSVEAYISRGQAYHLQNKFDCAITDYNQTLELDPRSVEAYDLRGQIYAAKQDYDSAITDYDQAIMLNNEYPFAYFNRGQAYYAKKDYDQAINNYNQAITLKFKPEYVVYNSLGFTYYAKKDYDQAINNYNQAITLNPQYVEAYNNRGLAYAARKDYDSAITDYNQAITLNNKYFYSYLNRGLVYAAREDYVRAITDYDQAITLNDKYVAAYYSRGLAQMRTGTDEDKAKAIADFQRVLEISKDADWQQKVENALRELNAPPSATVTS